MAFLTKKVNIPPLTFTGITMKSEYSFENKGGYLQMNVSGEYDYWNMVEFPKYILQQSIKTKIDRVLVNGLAVTPEQLPIIERFFMAEKAAEILRHNVKLAIVWHPDLIDGFMETVAGNRAGLMRLFGTEAAAVEWLLDDSETPRSIFEHPSAS